MTATETEEAGVGRGRAHCAPGAGDLSRANDPSAAVAVSGCDQDDGSRGPDAGGRSQARWHLRVGDEEPRPTRAPATARDRGRMLPGGTGSSRIHHVLRTASAEGVRMWRLPVATRDGNSPMSMQRLDLRLRCVTIQRKRDGAPCTTRTCDLLVRSPNMGASLVPSSLVHFARATRWCHAFWYPTPSLSSFPASSPRWPNSSAGTHLHC